jgi:predicted component of type VI protein secretion system
MWMKRPVNYINRQANLRLAGQAKNLGRARQQKTTYLPEVGIFRKEERYVWNKIFRVAKIEVFLIKNSVSTIV